MITWSWNQFEVKNRLLSRPRQPKCKNTQIQGHFPEEVFCHSSRGRRPASDRTRAIVTPPQIPFGIPGASLPAREFAGGFAEGAACPVAEARPGRSTFPHPNTKSRAPVRRRPARSARLFVRTAAPSRPATAAANHSPAVLLRHRGQAAPGPSGPARRPELRLSPGRASGRDVPTGSTQDRPVVGLEGPLSRSVEFGVRNVE